VGHLGLAGRLASLRVAVLALALAAAAHAGAAVWGYLDEQGRPHVATEKLDDRYQLFFKGPTDAQLAASPREPVEALVETPLFRRLMNHPNVKRYEPLIARYAKQHDVDAALVKAMVAVESGFEPTAVSNKGALGLMQVVPETAERYGVVADSKRTIAQKLFDPETNLRIGTQYLRDLLALFTGDVTLALAAYNAGEAAVQRYDNRVPPFPETQEFVRLVTQFYAVYKPPAPAPKGSRITVPKHVTAPAKSP
jgi:soluble lytic murein transglycosylase-like protein